MVGKHPRLRRWVSVGVVVLFAAGTFVDLRHTAKTLHATGKLWKSAFIAGAGMQASVPNAVWEAEGLLAARGLSSERFRLSKKFNDDPFVQQRMWEALYPVRFSDDPGLIVISEYPVVPKKGCRVESRSSHVALIACQ